MILNGRKSATVIIAGTATILMMPVTVSLNTSQELSLQQPLMELGFNSIALANAGFQYVPPNRGTPKSTQGTGSRGCTQSVPVTVSLLVPSDHDGQTVSSHPTFFWTVSDKTSIPLEFTLVEPGVAKPLFVRRMEVTRGGIAQVALPKDLPELVSGKKYRWSVSLVCNDNRPSNNVFVQSWIERVSPKPELDRELAAVGSESSDRARVYARSGLWYDTLSTLATNYAANPNALSNDADFRSLLEQGKN